MRRVAVIGCSGAGKSTFAQALAARTGLPLVSIDAHFWQPGWREPNLADFRARLADVAATDAWITDGNYLTNGANTGRLERADTVIWFDRPAWRCLISVIGRIAKSHGRVRPDMAPGCPEHVDLKFLRYVATFDRKQRPKLQRAVEGLHPDQRVVVFRNRRDARAFLAGTPAS